MPATPLLALALLFFAPPATPTDVVCPLTVRTEQKAAQAPEGWEISSEVEEARLASVTFYDGPPAERASLVYDREIPGDSIWTAVWTFTEAPRTEAPRTEAPRGLWLACGYDRTGIVLSRRLPAGTSECRVVYENDASTGAGLPVIRSMQCRGGPASTVR